MQFEIKPHVGIGPIEFGQTRDAVQTAMAQLGEAKLKRSDDSREGYFNGAFQVNYDDSGKVEFIETASSRDFEVLFHGEALHDMEADAAVEFVSQFADFDAEEEEIPYSYQFPAIDLSLWRGTLPLDENDEDYDEEDEDGRYFEAVGLGTKGYFSA